MRLRESQVSCESCRSIFRLGLEVIVPGPVCTNLEGISDITSTSHSEYLIVHQRTNCVVVTVPDIACIGTDFPLGRQCSTWTWTWTWTWAWTRRIASPLRKQRRRCKRKGEQNQKSEKSDSHLSDHLHLGHDPSSLAIEETYSEAHPQENYRPWSKQLPDMIFRTGRIRRCGG